MRSTPSLISAALLGSLVFLAGPTIVSATDQPAAACPEPEFDSFLKRFGHEIAFQEKSVADPLQSDVLDPTAEPEPKMVTTNIALKDVEWPVIADLTMLARGGKDIILSDEADGIKKVLIRTPDTGEQQAYYFARKPCWQLIRMSDESM